VKDPDLWQQPRPFRLAILTNTTYDGICYDAHLLARKLGHLCEYLLFDEAWMAYAKFHPLYERRFAMSLTDLGPDDPGIMATQSTHKCLAGMSQASQIHVRDSHIAGQPRCTGHDRFNEVFMMHTSTSPQYNIIASLDVGAEIMRGAQGVAIMDDAIRESIALRKQVERFNEEVRAREADSQKRWFFDIFGPHAVNLDVDVLKAARDKFDGNPAVRTSIDAAITRGGLTEVPWREVDDDLLANIPECWMFHEGDDWHDLTGLPEGYIMLDPTKCSLVTPGIEDGRRFSAWGIPAAVPAAMLRARGVVNEKTSFYTILLLVTGAIERGKSGTVLSLLLDIKRLYDEDASVAQALPDLVEQHPACYEGRGLQDLCDEMHHFLKDNKADVLQREAYAAPQEPEIVLSPAEAQARFVAGAIESVALDEVAGRIAATLVVVYPPGLAVMVPGERYGDESAAVRYLQLFQAFDNRFPGFESEMQGVFPRRQEDGSLRYFTYVLKEES
jgi:ornithine decarboxylase